MNELTQEQRVQAIMEFQEQMKLLPLVLESLTTDEQRQALANDIAARKTELGIEQFFVLLWILLMI